MSNPKPSVPGADWTKLFGDPDFVNHLATLLRAYRDAPPEKRDQALIEAMREIKSGKAKPATATAEKNVAEKAGSEKTGSEKATPEKAPEPPPAHAAPVVTAPDATSPDATPPFEPDIFTPSWGQDRRRYPRMKCFTAVELRTEGSSTPIWGNLSNTSMGGCFVEIPVSIPSGVKLEIGLWVANGKIWVKGMSLTGIVTRSNPECGVRVKFMELESSERETLRQFLKVVETATRGYQNDQGYLAQMKR